MFDIWLSTLETNNLHIHYINIFPKNICGSLRKDDCY